MITTILQMSVKQVLPDLFDYKIVSEEFISATQFCCNLRVAIGEENDFKKWLRSFEKITGTTWNVRRSRSECRYKFNRKFVCHHSSYNKYKLGPSSISKKDRNCNAFIKVFIKRNTKNTRYHDDYVKLGLFGAIKINFQHTHELNVEEAWNWLKRSDDTKEAFINYFEHGLTPAEARTYHEHLILKHNPEYLINSRENPPQAWVYELHARWRKKMDEQLKNSANFNSSDSEDNEVKRPKIAVHDFEIEIEALSEAEGSTIIEDYQGSKINLKSQECQGSGTEPQKSQDHKASINKYEELQKYRRSRIELQDKQKCLELFNSEDNAVKRPKIAFHDFQIKKVPVQIIAICEDEAKFYQTSRIEHEESEEDQELTEVSDIQENAILKEFEDEVERLRNLVKHNITNGLLLFQTEKFVQRCQKIENPMQLSSFFASSVKNNRPDRRKKLKCCLHQSQNEKTCPGAVVGKTTDIPLVVNLSNIKENIFEE